MTDQTAPMPDLAMSRRAVLGAGAAALGTAAVAACSSTSGSGTAQSPASSSSGGGKQSLVALSSIKVGEAVSAQLPDGSPVIVARPTAKTAAAFSAICTHMGCTVAPAGKQLQCPCHGSLYNATTGAVISGPAPKPLPRVRVHVANGEVVAGG
jgi:Rieske Fe-S protein